MFAAQKHLVRILSEPNHRILVVRKVARTLRHSVFALFRDLISEWNLTKLFKINKSDMEITCVNGNQILFAGLDDVEKLKSITGITSIWIEEASEIAESDFNQLDLRLRGKSKNYKQITLTFNPISALSWLKGHFFDVVRPNVTKLKTTYIDNKFIDAEYKEMIEGLKDKDYVLYQIYALGEWGVLGNLIYTNWEVKEISTDEEDYGSTYQGLDFGFNNPSAYVKSGLKDDDIYIFKEFYRKGLTNTELIEALEDVADKNKEIVGDSAEPDRIKEFKQSGYRRIKGAKKEKYSVKGGIDYLRGRKIYVHPNCVNTIKELQSYKYKEDKDGNVFDEPVDMFNHCLTGDTVVNTDDGDYKIEDLLGKDGYLHCYDEEKQARTKGYYSDVRKTRTQVDVYQVLLADGRVIKGTKDHPILTNEGWVQLGDLTPEHEVVDINITT